MNHRQNAASETTGAAVSLDMLRGAVAGAVGVWVMDRVDWLMYEQVLDTRKTRRQTEAARPAGMDPAHTMAHRAAHAVEIEPPSPPQENAAGHPHVHRQPTLLSQRRTSLAVCRRREALAMSASLRWREV